MLKNDLVANESEQSVIGGLLLEPTAWDIASQILKESDFSHACHKVIYRAFSALATQNTPFDVVTVSDWLEKQNLLSTAGGFEYLVNVARNTPSAANIETYAKTVKDVSIVRQLIATGELIAKLPNGTPKTPIEMLNEASAMIESIGEGNATAGGFKPFKSVLLDAVDKIDAAFQNQGCVTTGVATGFIDLDFKTSGFQASDLIYIAARPSMGKTAFLLSTAATIAETLPVAIFSLEMSGEQLATRLISSLGRIDGQHLKTGQINDDEWPRFNLAINQLSQLKLFIDDTGGVDVNYIRAKSKQLTREQGKLGAIFIDYLGLMDHKASFSNHEAGISKTSGALKALAKELQIPVIALSQLNREVEKRGDKRPQLSDLRGSGSIEQDADLVLFIYRDEVYNEESPDKGTAEIIIAKQRNGPIGMVRLAFRGQFTRFENFSRGEQHYE